MLVDQESVHNYVASEGCISVVSPVYKSTILNKRNYFKLFVLKIR